MRNRSTAVGEDRLRDGSDDVPGLLWILQDVVDVHPVLTILGYDPAPVGHEDILRGIRTANRGGQRSVGFETRQCTPVRSTRQEQPQRGEDSLIESLDSFATRKWCSALTEMWKTLCLVVFFRQVDGAIAQEQDTPCLYYCSATVVS